MATNKRKEAAALFELIDKSTLKVPKHAGALKIPEWWSSKTNPAAIAPPAPLPPPVPSPPRPPVAPAATTPPVVAPVQSRLFEPPAVGDTPAASPSIRPPALHSPAAAAAGVPAVAREPRVPVAAVSSEVAPAVRRQFLPQTAAQGPDMKPQWGGQQRRRMARTPKWAVLAGALGVVIVVSLIVYLALAGRRHWAGVGGAGKAREPAVVVGGGGQAPSESGTPLLPPAAGGVVPAAPLAGSSQLLPPSPPQTDGGTAPDGEATEDVREGKVYGPGVVKHSPELYYLMISSTPTASVAQKNAEFLAKHGVDVSIEIVGSANGKTRWYKLISVQGFPTLVEAEPFRKKIVAIGHLTPDFRKYHKVWDDAFPAHVSSAGK